MDRKCRLSRIWIEQIEKLNHGIIYGITNWWQFALWMDVSFIRFPYRHKMNVNCWFWWDVKVYHEMEIELALVCWVGGMIGWKLWMDIWWKLNKWKVLLDFWG